MADIASSGDCVFGIAGGGRDRAGWERSAAFYATVFGRKLRQRGDRATAFDVPVGAVSGALVLVNGGELARPIGVDAPEIAARFRARRGICRGCIRNRAEPRLLPYKR